MLYGIITPIILIATYIYLTVAKHNYDNEFMKCNEIDWNEYYAHAHN